MILFEDYYEENMRMICPRSLKTKLRSINHGILGRKIESLYHYCSSSTYTFIPNCSGVAQVHRSYFVRSPKYCSGGNLTQEVPFGSLERSFFAMLPFISSSKTAAQDHIILSIGKENMLKNQVNNSQKS